MSLSLTDFKGKQRKKWKRERRKKRTTTTDQWKQPNNRSKQQIKERNSQIQNNITTTFKIINKKNVLYDLLSSQKESIRSRETVYKKEGLWN